MTSKTGLIPIQRAIPIFEVKKTSAANLSMAAVSKRIELTIRPFGELDNPFPKACSVLCNHPIPSVVRSNIQKAKTSLSFDVRNKQFEAANTDQHSDQIPEMLFQHYTHTDSRPLTASPTTGSIRTRTSGASFLNTRRCITPEPQKNTIDKRKKIILDLRRSHSQETLHWSAFSEISQLLTNATPNTCGENSSSYQDEKISLKNTKSDEIRLKNVIVSEKQSCDQESKLICVNERDPEEIEDYLHSRGKRRKKSKALAAISAPFHISQDPETQISTLGPDSVNASTRPSLIPEPLVLLPKINTRRESQPTPIKGSFLPKETFNILKAELDIDRIENTFERYLNKARQEVIQFLPENKSKFSLQPTGIDFEQEIKIPRKLSKSSSRFEMPLNLKSLERTTVTEYLSQYVWVSRQRKQIYKRTFLKYIDEKTQERERLMLILKVPRALEDVLGFYGSQDVIEKVMNLVFRGIVIKNTERQQDNITSSLPRDYVESLDFRLWCGIVAFAERVVLIGSSTSDSCDELEKADFETMEERINSMNVSKTLRDVLFIIRKGHYCSI